MIRAALVILALLATFAFPASAPAQSKMKAGVGRVVITPKADMWMAGYASRSGPSAGKVQELFAKALAIEDESGARSIILTTDLLGLTASLSARTSALALEKFGVPRERLMLTASHTHCGPVLRENLSDMYGLDETQTRLVSEYTEALPALFIEAMRQAIDSLGPCTFAWGVGSADFAVNRRQYTLTGVVIGVNPIGPVDHDVPVLAARRADGSLLAALFGYACHNTTLAFMQFCGDYAGYAQETIEAASPGATALFVSGCGGDANPNPRGELTLAKAHGASLGRSVLAVLDKPLSEVHGPLAARYQEVDLALSDPPSREDLRRQTADQNAYVARRARRLLQNLDRDGALAKSYSYPIQVWQFSDTLQITALAGEVVVDYSLRLKHELGRERQFVIGYANDVFAYIPSLRVLREGGYEASDAMIYYGLHGPWAPAVEETIVSTVHELSKK